MNRTLIIAEKPSMGRDIASALAHMNNTQMRPEGLCVHVGNITVIGAQGHLFQLASPEHYGDAFSYPWRIDPLPIIPQPFVIEPNFQKDKGRVVENSHTQSIRARLAAVKELLLSATSVVHAGDPDREGQLIIDDILVHYGYKGPVKRLWLHAQTRDGIQSSWRAMKDNSAYEHLGIAAVARRESDWAIGMNATRAYTATWWKKGHKSVLNIGRVVTPLVGMIVQREKDIQSFVPLNHFTVKATICITGYEPFQALWVKPEGEGRPEFDPTGKLVVDRNLADGIRAKCDGQMATIVSADTEPKREPPPLLFSLVELQKAAAKMGYSPDKVLEAAQALYEKHKLTSYPRTECQYAPESEHGRAAHVVQAIFQNFGSSWTPVAGWDVQRKSRAWNDKKLAEHYAILPLSTSCSVGQLSRIEADVYQLICRQYLAQFFPDFEYLASVLVAEVAGERFKASGRAPTVEGWRVLYGGSAAIKRSEDPENDEQAKLPAVKVGETGLAQQVELVANKTKPPVRFTSVTMLEAMEKAYLYVTDPKVKARLKQVEGIGTAATRAAIIAKAVATELAGEDKSGRIITYFPTPKAFGYIQCLPDTLTRPDLTAWFEGKLDELASGTLNYVQYRAMLERLVNHIIGAAKDGTALQQMPSPDAMPAPVATAKKRKSGGGKSKRVQGAAFSRPRYS